MTKKWWNEKVAYQIYPKSFYDTNGDGIGDLRGVIEKLDYLKDLGIDIIWLSPCYRSPLADQGYDISDYYDIDPRFGTMDDMDELIAEAKKRDMYILMDLVVNHCSDELNGLKRPVRIRMENMETFFYLRDKKEGELPTNWRSYFGGSAWENLPGTNKQYLHVFHKKTAGSETVPISSCVLSLYLNFSRLSKLSRVVIISTFGLLITSSSSLHFSFPSS